ncbi:MAG TPA: alkyl sulfatase dimerization domain-containing protein [Caulobacteraceae bacterium]|nr:alkyl sulfatase dimerization domain-containing protein [Caulobacteraceae bacterium]
MADLIGMSSSVIDGTADMAGIGPLNRINHQLSEIADGVAMVEAFSHCVLFATADGLVAFDTSGPLGGPRVVDAVRRWRPSERFNTLVYTHGHIDHVGGAGAFVADAEGRKQPRPCFVGHENVPRRFDRYNLTDGYNRIINERQFGQFARAGLTLGGEARFLPAASPRPDTTYAHTLDLEVGGLAVELKHAKGETDDHTWAWIPSRKAICAGDFFIWNFPNAGNPQKVQRYPAEWAAAMRAMAAQGAELFLPAHGLPIAGQARIRKVLTEVAEALERLVADTLLMMNDGAPLNEIIHSVKVDPDILARPYLRPLYDEPEFVVRNIWRLYGGWYDGNPAHLKPARETALASELARLAGGAAKLAERALAVAEDDVRVACHLVEFAAQAEPDDARIHAVRAEIYQRRRDRETSLMAKGIFGAAANDSRARTGGT